MISRKDLNITRVTEPVGWYISGFVDGEGSFNVSLRRKSDYKVGWQPVLSFNVSQRERTMLALMKQYFNCGIIKRRKDGLYSYDVTNPKAIQGKIVPFFEKYKFLSNNKKKNFSIFKKVVVLMSNRKHLESAGFIGLLRLREKLNEGKGRTRKYTLSNVLESSETTRRILI